MIKTSLWRPAPHLLQPQHSRSYFYSNSCSYSCSIYMYTLALHFELDELDSPMGRPNWVEMRLKPLMQNFNRTLPLPNEFVPIVCHNSTCHIQLPITQRHFEWRRWAVSPLIESKWNNSTMICHTIKFAWKVEDRRRADDQPVWHPILGLAKNHYCIIWTSIYINESHRL